MVVQGGGDVAAAGVVEEVSPARESVDTGVEQPSTSVAPREAAAAAMLPVCTEVAAAAPPDGPGVSPSKKRRSSRRLKSAKANLPAGGDESGATTTGDSGGASSRRAGPVLITRFFRGSGSGALTAATANGHRVTAGQVPEQPSSQEGCSGNEQDLDHAKSTVRRTAPSNAPIVRAIDLTADEEECKILSSITLDCREVNFRACSQHFQSTSASTSEECVVEIASSGTAATNMPAAIHPFFSGKRKQLAEQPTNKEGKKAATADSSTKVIKAKGKQQQTAAGVVQTKPEESGIERLTENHSASECTIEAGPSTSSQHPDGRNPEQCNSQEYKLWRNYVASQQLREASRKQREEDLRMNDGKKAHPFFQLQRARPVCDPQQATFGRVGPTSTFAEPFTGVHITQTGPLLHSAGHGALNLRPDGDRLAASSSTDSSTCRLLLPPGKRHEVQPSPQLVDLSEEHTAARVKQLHAYLNQMAAAAVQKDEGAGVDIGVDDHEQHAIPSINDLLRRLETYKHRSSHSLAHTADCTAQQTSSAVDGVAQNVPWTEQYKPRQANEVCGNENSVTALHEWLLDIKKQISSQGSTQTASQPRHLESGSAWSREADDSNDDSADYQQSLNRTAILLYGPAGVGKTAAVYACASQLGYKVIEVNASDQRSGSNLIRKFQEATESASLNKYKHKSGSNTKPTAHNLASRLNAASETKQQPIVIDDASCPAEVATASKAGDADNVLEPEAPELQQTAPVEVLSQSTESPVAVRGRKRRSRRVSFSPSPLKLSRQKRQQHSSAEPPSEPAEEVSTQHASLMLLEEVDVLFDDDKGFWPAVSTILANSKRPVILTSNVPEVCPQLPGLHIRSLKFVPPVASSLVTHAHMICTAEGVAASPPVLHQLALACESDIRRTILAAQFWLQAVPVCSPVHADLRDQPSGCSASRPGQTDPSKATTSEEHYQQEQLIAEGRTLLFPAELERLVHYSIVHRSMKHYMGEIAFPCSIAQATATVAAECAAKENALQFESFASDVAAELDRLAAIEETNINVIEPESTQAAAEEGAEDVAADHDAGSAQLAAPLDEDAIQEVVMSQSQPADCHEACLADDQQAVDTPIGLQDEPIAESADIDNQEAPCNPPPVDVDVEGLLLACKRVVSVEELTSAESVSKLADTLCETDIWLAHCGNDGVSADAYAEDEAVQAAAACMFLALRDTVRAIPAANADSQCCSTSYIPEAEDEAAWGAVLAAGARPRAVKLEPPLEEHDSRLFENLISARSIVGDAAMARSAVGDRRNLCEYTAHLTQMARMDEYKRTHNLGRRRRSATNYLLHRLTRLTDEDSQWLCRTMRFNKL
eukprot:jgi/Chlat1/4410/Chrsp29S04548